MQQKTPKEVPKKVPGRCDFSQAVSMSGLLYD
jgi:hypothetical protein